MINIGTGLISIELDWTAFKAIVAGKSLKLQHITKSGMYQIFAIDDSIVYSTNIFIGDIPPVCDVDQATNDANKADFETYHLAGTNKRLSAVTQDNTAMLVTHVGREGDEYTIATPNLCDRTTWYYTSERNDNVVLSSSNGGLTYYVSGASDSWVDMYHGKFFQEYTMREYQPHKYEVIVTVNDVTQSMRAPFVNSGGDYVVNYRSGSIDFTTPVVGSTVKASFNKVVDSKFCLAPLEGKYIDVEEVEVQFTADVDMKDRIVFEVQGFVQYFAPAMCEIYGGPLPLNTVITLQKTWYDTFAQLIDEALGSYPIVPAIGGTTRGTSQPTYGFPMRYATVRRMYNSYGLRSCIYLENDLEYGGERATATFYCIQNPES